MSSVFGFNTDIRYGDTVYHVQTEAREADLVVQTAIFVRGRCIEKQESSYAQDSDASGFTAASLQQLLTHQHKFIVNRIREGQIGSVQSVGQNAVVGSGAAGVTAKATAAPLPASGEPRVTAPPVPSPQQADEDQASGDVDILGMGSTPSWPQQTSAPESIPEPKAEPERKSMPQAEVAPEVADIPELKLEWLSSESMFEGNSVSLRYRLTRGPRGVEGSKIVARLEVGGVPSAYARTVSDCEGEGEVTFTLSSAAQQSAALTFTVQASHEGQSTARRFRLSRT